MSEEEIEKALERHRDHVNFFLSKKTLTLIVDVENVEQVDQILEWAYSDKKPMLAKLQTICWDQSMVPNEVAKQLDKLFNTMREY